MHGTPYIMYSPESQTPQIGFVEYGLYNTTNIKADVWECSGDYDYRIQINHPRSYACVTVAHCVMHGHIIVCKSLSIIQCVQCNVLDLIIWDGNTGLVALSSSLNVICSKIYQRSCCIFTASLSLSYLLSLVSLSG